MANILLFTGSIRPLPDSGRPSGIYKQPCLKPIALTVSGFVGDQQADLRVHGGPEKAVHLYPARHYARLAKAFPDAAPLLVPGCLGENLSTSQLDEHDVHIGEIFRLGEARLQLCQPRNPCWKIDERCQSDGMAAYIAEHRLTGWYFRVLTPGQVAPGDQLRSDSQVPGAMTLGAALELCAEHRPNSEQLLALANTPGLADAWRKKIISRYEWLRQNSPLQDQSRST